MMARAVRIDCVGGPSVIALHDVELSTPAAGEVRFRSTAIGLNFIDIYHRRGLYAVPLPTGLGIEAAGVVEAIGPHVTGFAEGDRVATFGPTIGAYAAARNVPASELFHIPDDIADETAAAVLLKGCTTEFLVERCGRVAAGMDVLVHAAAGGVGLLLVQWLKHVGARVIGTVSTDAKASAARKAGCDAIIRYRNEPVAARVRELTGGTGVNVVYDGIGRATWEPSLDSLGRIGLLVSYGNADAPVDGINLAILAQKGSLFVTRPTLFDYYAQPEQRAAGSARVWEMVRSGALGVTIGQTYHLEDAAQAHIELEAGQTFGSSLLLV